MTAAEIAGMDAARARNLTDKIKVAVEGTWQLISEAYISRAWAALGYSSWDDYCTREFGTSRLRLPREERQEVVSSLRDQGLSLRAIAAVTGDSEPTIRRTLAGASFDAPAAALVAESDALERRIADELARSDGQLIDPEPVTEVAPPMPEPIVATVTGTDGKAYPAKARTAPYRKPLPEVAKVAGWDARKAVERIERLFEDNRYQQNAEQVATALRGHLLYIAETVAAVLDQLP